MDLARWITKARYDEYLVAANHDDDSARELYEWNIAVSAAFFELISHVEVTLRNTVDRALRPLEVAETARVSPRFGWWFSSRSFLRESDLAFYRTACDHLGTRAETSSRDKVLASMTFGVWNAIFGPAYEGLFRHHLVHAFPNRPQTGFKREAVQKNVLALRTLRNRIAHHQAIFDQPLEERFEQAMDLLRWIDPGVEQWVLRQCRVPALLDLRPSAADSIAVVVPAADAWPFYISNGAYVCQPNRFFQKVSHVAFYKDAAIQPEIAKITGRMECVAWTPDEIGRRMRGSAEDRHIAEIIRASRAAGWTHDEYQLFLLTMPGPEGEKKGHVSLERPIVQNRRGRGSAWVQRQRYAAVSAMMTATTVADLDQH